MSPRNNARIPREERDIIHSQNSDCYPVENFEKEITEFMRCTLPFRHTKWTVGDLAKLARNCSVRKYEVETVIYDSNETDLYVYLVLKGSVRYVVEMIVKRTFKKLKVCNLVYGQFFAVGENMPGGKVISNEDSVCLLINKHYLTTNHRSFYNLLNDSLTTSLPTQDEIRKRYLIIEKWIMFKEAVLKEALFQCQLRREKRFQFL